MKRDQAELVIAAWSEMAQGPKFDQYVYACPETHLAEMAEAVKVLAPAESIPANLRQPQALALLVASAAAAPKAQPMKEAPKEPKKSEPVK